jgi:aryl-alcohol dehydrogenase (NADP+)
VTRIGTLDVSAVCLGGNVFGWTIDSAASFEVLDAFVEAGGNFIDTADVYSAWVEGNTGGDSERIIGDWMASRGNRDSVVIATKVGMLTGAKGLSRESIRRGVDASLERLQTDVIDLYYAHIDDKDTPLEETIGTLDELVVEGKVRHLGASNYSADRLRSALELDVPNSFVALQPLYNLSDRAVFEDDLAAVAAEVGLAVLPYYALASGFLTGKYRGRDTDPSTGRSAKALTYLDERGLRILDAMDQVAAKHGVELASIALAWLSSRPTVAAPVASARTAEQLSALMASMDVELHPDELAILDAASAA